MKNPFLIIFEIIILIIFLRLMFNLGFLVGLVYIFVIFMAFWKGLIFKKKNIAWMIILGTFLSYFAGLFIPYVFKGYSKGNLISATIMLIIAFLIWKKSRKLRRGRR